MGDVFTNDTKQSVRLILSRRLLSFYETMKAYWTEDAAVTLQRAEERVTLQGPDNNWHRIDR